MPTRWFLLRESSPGTIDAAHLHGLACALLEESGDDHTARYKPFASALPLNGLLSPTRPDGITEPDLLGLISEPLCLGGRLHRVAGAERHNVSYARLVSVLPADRVRAEFVTSTYVNRAEHQSVRAFTTLCLFAEFSGVGAQIIHGLGHVRVHRAERTRAPSEKRPGRSTGALSTTTPTPRHR